MFDKKLIKSGTIILSEGKIDLIDFEADGATCREVSALALLWAINELQKELSEIVAKPGGTGICCIN